VSRAGSWEVWARAWESAVWELLVTVSADRTERPDADLIAAEVARGARSRYAVAVVVAPGEDRPGPETRCQHVWLADGATPLACARCAAPHPELGQ
jgi:hypothetical protein